jgi:hypothetical protein
LERPPNPKGLGWETVAGKSYPGFRRRSGPTGFYVWLRLQAFKNKSAI